MKNNLIIYVTILYVSITGHLLAQQSNSNFGDTITIDNPDTGPIKASLTADKAVVNLNDNVTFTATASGGTQPYKYYWWLDGDQKWAKGDRQVVRQMNRQGTQTMYLVVIDSHNKATQEISFQVTVKPPAP